MARDLAERQRHVRLGEVEDLAAAQRALDDVDEAGVVVLRAQGVRASATALGAYEHAAPHRTAAGPDNEERRATDAPSRTPPCPSRSRARRARCRASQTPSQTRRTARTAPLPPGRTRSSCTWGAAAPARGRPSVSTSRSARLQVGADTDAAPGRRGDGDEPTHLAERDELHEEELFVGVELDQAHVRARRRDALRALVDKGRQRRSNHSRFRLGHRLRRERRVRARGRQRDGRRTISRSSAARAYSPRSARTVPPR